MQALLFVKQSVRNFIAVVVIASLFGAALSPMFIQKAEALSGSDFSAGHVIDDAIFTNNNAMSVTEIQNFLNSKVPSCDTSGSQSKSYYYNSSTGRINNSADTWVTTSRAVYGQRYDTANGTTYAHGPYTCLRDYYENTSTHQNNLQGNSVSGGISAAQIIKNAADNYQINPEVILTTLQKEQGLITDDWPWANEYSAAMGYSCPDTGNGCNSTYAGFYKQVDNATWQFRYYLEHPNAYNYWIGNYYVQYNPNSSCGGSVINIQNAATAALYIYTPYQPNAAALANMPGSGDNCSAYGVRNFWYYFNNWFGTSIVKDAYAWSVVSNTAYTDSVRTAPYTIGKISVAPGSKAYVRMVARNAGYHTWTKSVVRLGTSQPSDRASVFSDSSWLNDHRIAMTNSSVSSGDDATFDFSITAPSQVGTYYENFNLVAEGATWMNDPGMRLTIDVVNPSTPQSTDATLSSGEALTPGQFLLSPDTYSVFTLQGDGNTVLYDDYAPAWAANVSNAQVTKLLMQSDGNLVEYAGSKVVWASGTDGHPGAYAKLQSDGNFVIYSSGNVALWASGTSTNPGHLAYVTNSAVAAKIFPGQKLRTPNGYTLLMQADGNLVAYSKTGGKVLWASGTDGNTNAYACLLYTSDAADE